MEWFFSSLPLLASIWYKNFQDKNAPEQTMGMQSSHRLSPISLNSQLSVLYFIIINRGINVIIFIRARY